MITSIYTGVRGGGFIVCTRLLLLVECDDERLLARLKMGNATPLGSGRGFRLHGNGKRGFLVTPLRPSGNKTIASTTAYTVWCLRGFCCDSGTDMTI
jgi:hypothetical protein